MKRILSILSCALLLTTAVSCDWFQLDNQEGWDAKVSGRILDAKTGQPVQSEQGSSITVIEQGWTHPVSGDPVSQNQTWRIKNDGTYTNNLVFAGEYIMNTVSNANFMAEPAKFTLNKGDNTVDFTVTPFCRILNPKVTYDAATKVITATFAIEAGSAQVNNIGNVYLCVYPDRFVRNGYNKCKDDPFAHAENVNPDGTTQVTLTLDPERVVNGKKVNADEFQYDRPHYIRIAAVGGHYAIQPAYDETQETTDIDWDHFPWDKIASDWSNWNDLVADGSIQYITKVTVIHHDAVYANDGSINGSNAYNYSPVFKLENGQITEVTDW